MILALFAVTVKANGVLFSTDIHATLSNTKSEHL